MSRAERSRELQGMQQDLRNLAADFEREGRADDAAAVYYNLAYLPSVDVVKDAQGRVVVEGYTSSYDAKEQRRKADMDRAFALNRSNAHLRYSKLFASHEEAGIFVLVDKSKSELRQRYVSDTERHIAQDGERVWPWVFKGLWQAYVAEGQYAEGCRAIQRYHDFEPAYRTTDGWERIRRDFDARLSNRKIQGVTCSIAGLK